MAFPQTARDIYAEMFLGTEWVDVGSDILQRSAIQIERGSGDEADHVQPTTCNVDLKNPNGHYSPRNPNGDYYGLIGRNTPLRVGFRAITDDFGTPVTDGWGTTDTGETWSLVGAGGSVQNSDWQVTAGGKGTQSVPATAAYRYSYLASRSYKNVEVRCKVTIPITNVTGGDLEPGNIILRRQSATDFYLVRLVITSAEAVTLAIRHETSGSVIAGPTTITGLTHTSSNEYWVAGQVDGMTLRAKVWLSTADEPYDWQVSGVDPSARIITAGTVGVRSGVASANTNTLPIVFSYDDFEVRIPQAATEISEIIPYSGSDASGNDPWVSVKSAGILRRLNQGDPPELSSMRSGLINATPAPVAYWPCEDGSDSSLIASGLPGKPDMHRNSKFPMPRFASNDDFDCSAPLLEIGHAEIRSFVAAYDNPNEEAQIRFLLHVPTDEDAGANNGIILRVFTTGTAAIWDIVYTTAGGGSLTLNVYNQDAALVHTSGATDFDVTGSLCRISLELAQDGTAVDWALSKGDVPDEIGSGSAGGFSGTVTSHTLGTVHLLVMSVGLSGTTETPFDKTAVGHITVHNEITDVFDMLNELAAWNGELAGDRFLRRCEQEGIETEFIGTLRTAAFDPRATQTAKMGPQFAGTFVDHITECADADRAFIYESQTVVGALGFRAHETFTNQDAQTELDYAAHEVQPPLNPPFDDQGTVNYITVKRLRGSEYRTVQETGPLNVQLPQDDPQGVGRIPGGATVNVFADAQLPDIGRWLRNLGTTEDGRYPEILVDLANPNVVANSGLSESLFGVDIGDRITIANASAIGEYDTISQLVLSQSITLNRFTHTIEFNGTPEPPYQVIEFDDGEVSRFNSADSTLSAGVTSSATSLSVAFTTYRWVTLATHFPFNIEIGGEVMTISGITGTTSPQTFTVSDRSVNGVVKSHSAGAEVHLARRARFALAQRG